MMVVSPFYFCTIKKGPKDFSLLLVMVSDMQYIAIIDLNNGELPVRELLGLPLVARLALTLRDLGFKHVFFVNRLNLDLSKTLQIIDDRGGINYEVLNHNLEPPGNMFSKLESETLIAYVPINVCPESAREILSANLQKISEFNDKKQLVFKITGPKESDTKIILGRIEPTSRDHYRFRTVDEALDTIENESEIIEIHSDNLMLLRDKKSLKLCEKTILKRLGKPDDGIISRYINRKISTLISKHLVATRITPNSISLLSFLLMVISAFLFAIHNKYWVFAGVLAQFSSIIDGCDGEIARLRFKPSAFGALLDTILDRYSDILLLAGIAYHYALVYPSIFIVVFLCVSLSATLLSGLVRKEFTLRFGTAPEPSFLLQITRRDMRIFVIFIGAIVGYLFHFVLGLSILIHFIIIYKYLSMAPKS